jgi:hypothetical protein
MLGAEITDGDGTSLRLNGHSCLMLSKRGPFSGFSSISLPPFEHQTSTANHRSQQLFEIKQHAL